MRFVRSRFLPAHPCLVFPQLSWDNEKAIVPRPSLTSVFYRQGIRLGGARADDL